MRSTVTACRCYQTTTAFVVWAATVMATALHGDLAAQEKSEAPPESALKNVTIYSPRSKPLTFTELEGFAKNHSAELKLLKGEEDNWESVELEWEGKSLQIFSDPSDDHSEHLQGFTGYVLNRLADGEMDYLVFATMRQIRRTRHVYGCLGKPALHDTSMEFVSDIAKQHRALLFLDDSVWSPELKVIIGTDDRRGEKTMLPAFPSAIERKERSNAKLENAGVQVNADLPLIVTDEEVHLRDAQQVARRALCLFAVARYGQDADDFDPIQFLKDNDAWSEISEDEKAFLEDTDPKQATKNTLTWRFESCQALLWCLDQRTIDFPNEVVSVHALNEVVMENAKTLVEKAKLRPTKEILDHADLVYRCLWAGRQARIDKKEPTSFNISVVYERVYALNWIIRLLDADWDSVPTDS